MKGEPPNGRYGSHVHSVHPVDPPSSESSGLPGAFRSRAGKTGCAGRPARNDAPNAGRAGHLVVHTGCSFTGGAARFVVHGGSPSRPATRAEWRRLAEDCARRTIPPRPRLGPHGLDGSRPSRPTPFMRPWGPTTPRTRRRRAGSSASWYSRSRSSPPSRLRSCSSSPGPAPTSATGRVARSFLRPPAAEPRLGDSPWVFPHAPPPPQASRCAR